MTDFDARAAVQEMVAEIRSGRTPAVVEELLRRESLRARTDRGPLAGWLFGVTAPTFHAGGAWPFEDAGFFQRSCVLRLYAREQVFRRRTLPGSGSIGLCALGPQGLHYLERRPDDVEGLLQGADAEIQRCAPRVLASLLLETLACRDGWSHGVLESADHLLHYDREQPTPGYRVHVSEWERAQARFVAPRLLPDPTATWRLECCSVLGWMHDKRQLVSHRFRFFPRPGDPYRAAPAFRIEHEEEVLSQQIFDRVPQLRY